MGKKNNLSCHDNKHKQQHVFTAAKVDNKADLDSREIVQKIAKKVSVYYIRKSAMKLGNLKYIVKHEYQYVKAQ